MECVVNVCNGRGMESVGEHSFVKPTGKKGRHRLS